MTDSNNRCCHNINCDKCKNREIEFNRMKNKMEKYQQALDILMDDSFMLEKTDRPNRSRNYDNVMFESVIFETSNDGKIVKKTRSDIGESYIVIDSGKNLDEINKDEQAAIKKQDEFANYESTAKYFKKGTIVYGIGCTVVNVGKYFVSFL